MRRRPKSEPPNNPRKRKLVPLENLSESRPWQALHGSEYLELITSVERCVGRDVERERLLTLDPKTITTAM